MRFLHIADLHFGKQLYELPLIEEDQPFWVDKFLKLAEDKKPDAVLIAGDVYDRTAPSNEAVMLLDRLVSELAGMNIPVMMISGNHDSGQKLSFAGDILSSSGVHISGLIKKDIPKVTLTDEYGNVNFWLVPYLFPSAVSDALEDKEIRSYDEAFRKLLDAQDIDWSERNVIVAHQNVTAFGNEPERGGSESMIGGVGGIDYTVFERFDYAALGHIHKAQKMGCEHIRYAGSPLCYHFEETRFSKKGPVLVELGEKGTAARIEVCPIEPLHPLIEINGSYEDIIKEQQETPVKNSYIKIVLTDCRLTPERSSALHIVFEERDCIIVNASSSFGYTPDGEKMAASDHREKTTEELFSDFFLSRTSGEMNEKERDIIFLAVNQGKNSDSKSVSDKDVDKLVKLILQQEGIEYETADA